MESHSVTCYNLTLAKQTSTQLTNPRKMKSLLDLGVGYILRWFTCTQTVTHLRSKHEIATSPEVDPIIT